MGLISCSIIAEFFDSQSSVCRHDVSWGTKGSDKVDLPSATSKKEGGDKAVVETVEKKQEELDSSFSDVVARATAPIPVTAEAAEKPSMDVST